MCLCLQRQWSPSPAKPKASVHKSFPEPLEKSFAQFPTEYYVNSYKLRTTAAQKPPALLKVQKHPSK